MSSLAHDSFPDDGVDNDLAGEFSAGVPANDVNNGANSNSLLDKYTPSSNDELLKHSALGVQTQPAANALANLLADLPVEQLHKLQLAINTEIRRAGITFTVYDESGNIDRPWPLDAIPRIIDAQEWQSTEQGLIQRLKALNCFLSDIYSRQQIVRDGIIPAALIESSNNFFRPCIGMQPAFDTWAHICGTDLVRDESGTFRVLEDNLRVPSGVSYMLENRRVMKRVAPEMFATSNVLPVDDYTTNLKQMLESLSPNDTANIAVLTPGIFNSAYFEHAYLARETGSILVEGRDLVVSERDGFVYADTIHGMQRIDVIYRRVDDRFLDPECMNPQSTLGVKGLMRAWNEGKVGMANTPGTGVADDKVIYSYVPDMIKYYLNESPLIANVDTYRCSDNHSLAYVLDNLQDLVIKPANESGGYGMLMGPDSTAQQRKEFYKLLNESPRNYIAQPVVQLSTCPTVTGPGLGARHVDLRPYVIQGERSSVTTGGLTRVALRNGSLIVNSSQGGGSKDTWVVKC